MNLNKYSSNKDNDTGIDDWRGLSKPNSGCGLRVLPITTTAFIYRCSLAEKESSVLQLINGRLALSSCDFPAVTRGDAQPCLCSHQLPVYQQTCTLMIDTQRTNYDTSVHSLSYTATND